MEEDCGVEEKRKLARLDMHANIVSTLYLSPVVGSCMSKNFLVKSSYVVTTGSNSTLTASIRPAQTRHRPGQITQGKQQNNGRMTEVRNTPVDEEAVTARQHVAFGNHIDAGSEGRVGLKPLPKT